MRLVGDKLLHRLAGDFAPDRVEPGKHHGIGRVVNRYRHPRGGFKGPDIPPVAADDAAFHLLAWQRDGRRGHLGSHPAGITLDRDADDAPGLFVRRGLGVVEDVPGQRVGVRQSLVFHLFQQLGAGLALVQLGGAGQLFPAQLDQAGEFAMLHVQFTGPLVERFLILPELVFGTQHGGQLGIDQVVALADAQLQIGQFLPAGGENRLGLFALLGGFLVGGQPRLALDAFRLDFGGFD